MVIVYLFQVIWEIEGRSDGAKSGDSKESISIHYGVFGSAGNETNYCRPDDCRGRIN
jgi:hypothetical protein